MRFLLHSRPLTSGTLVRFEVREARLLQCIATAPVVAGAKRNELGSQTPQSTSRRLVLQVRPCTDKWSRWTGRMRRYPGGGRGRASRRAVVRPVRRSVPSAPRRIVSLSSSPTRAAGSTLLRAMPRLAGDRGPVCRRAAQLRAGRSARWSPPQTISRCFWRILQAVSTRRRATPPTAGARGQVSQRAGARLAVRSARCSSHQSVWRCFSPIRRVVSMQPNFSSRRAFISGADHGFLSNRSCPLCW